jgi:enoyl-[acyl-carrier protein] reductase I
MASPFFGAWKEKAMGLFTGKKGVILGVANDHSMAWAVAQALHREGADIGFSHLPDKEGRNRNEMRIRKLVDPIGAKLVAPLDVQDDAQVREFFGKAKECFGTLDFVLHSIAFGLVDDIQGPTLNCSREGFKLAMDVSCYSLIAVSRAAAEMMNSGGSIAAMTYFGGEKVVDGYNMMGICKSALDMTIRYLAFDLGTRNVRVNGVSAGPMRTLAASAVGDFREMLSLYEAVSPLGRNITPEEVGNATMYLLSHLSSATTGEIHHVDCGYNIMGSPGRGIEKMKQALESKA